MEGEGQLEVAEKSGILLNLRLADSLPNKPGVLQGDSSAFENGLVSTHHISQKFSLRKLIAAGSARHGLLLSRIV